MTLAAVLAVVLAAAPAGPRLFVLTDIGGDTDDQQSMVRLLLHADSLDVEGLCATSRLEHGHDTRPELLREPLGAYALVRERPEAARRELLDRPRVHVIGDQDGHRSRLVRDRLFGDAADFLDGVPNERHSVARWRNAFQRDLAARLDWCLASRREAANHPPAPALPGGASDGPLEIEASAGETVPLDASSSRDPDGDALDFLWRVYPEAGEGLPEPVRIDGAVTPRARVHVPRPTGLRSIHVVLEVTDRGRPPLTRYRRVVLRVRGGERP